MPHAASSTLASMCMPCSAAAMSSGTASSHAASPLAAMAARAASYVTLHRQLLLIGRLFTHEMSHASSNKIIKGEDLTTMITLLLATSHIQLLVYILLSPTSTEKWCFRGTQPSIEACKASSLISHQAKRKYFPAFNL
ncbi:hypothetical protein U9M48_015024 [Paspalum notatum var. saurae]|uniref:Uncharacterized protein n=1 Tax=Paspalum notatum var. saurae TaxID=547442 RepID=A0AAQ3T3U5_PASNO